MCDRLEQHPPARPLEIGQRAVGCAAFDLESHHLFEEIPRIIEHRDAQLVLGQLFAPLFENPDAVLEGLGRSLPISGKPVRATGGEQKLVVDSARMEYWTKNGAQVSDRVNFLVKNIPVKAPEAKAAKAAA